MIGAVLFDLDGTLVDTVHIRIESWVHALHRYGIAATRPEVAPLIGLDGRSLARRVAEAAGVPVDDQLTDEIDRAAGAVFEQKNGNPVALPGVQEIVRLMGLRQIPWAIATSSRRAQAEASVQALGLLEVATLIDGDHVPHAKPDPDLLLLAAETMHVDPAACWYVGDSTWDMLAAVAAGMVPVGVLAGSAVSEDALSSAGARIVAPSLRKLAGMMTTWAGPRIQPSPTDELGKLLKAGTFWDAKASRSCPSERKPR